MADTELKDQPGEWRDSYGHLHMMCVIEEITNARLGLGTAFIEKDDSQITFTSAQAIVVIGGLSVCREHFLKIVSYLQEGRPMTAVMIDALNGELV